MFRTLQRESAPLFSICSLIILLNTIVRNRATEWVLSNIHNPLTMSDKERKKHKDGNLTSIDLNNITSSSLRSNLSNLRWKIEVTANCMKSKLCMKKIHNLIANVEMIQNYRSRSNRRNQKIRIHVKRRIILLQRATRHPSKRSNW